MTAMNIRLDYLLEPKLQFGEYFEHEDSKTGLGEFGPFGRNVPGLHPEKINLGFVGTRETVSDCKEWIASCGAPMESENIKTLGLPSTLPDLFREMSDPASRAIRYEKILNRDFVGFNADSPFGCCFQINERWEKLIPATEIQAVLKTNEKKSRILLLVELFNDHVKSLAETSPAPDVIILALTPEIVEQGHSVQLSGNFYLNFRRAIKAKSMRWGVPIQLLQRRTVLGKGPELQERATRAWNFCTAQYYKADCVPWRPTTLEPNVCFVGISFYVTPMSKEKLRCVQASRKHSTT
jgi:hypothetical protein